jgi:GH24 family phage-related lysozyme (muramidase)
MTDMAERLIGEEEGRDACIYRDSMGLLTIGIGCLVDKSQIGAGLCDAAIAVQFQHDAATAQAIAGRFPHFAELNDVRQAVLISMTFQLGTKPLHWPNFMAAMEARDYEKAAVAGRDSDWWRVQTHARAERQMLMLASGQWVQKS